MGAEPRLGATRARVLAILQEQAGPAGIADVADRLGMHPNTARFHLDALVDAGLARSAAEHSTRPGRPRTVYTAVSEAPEHASRRYRLLSEMLVGLIESEVPDPAVTAERLGESWGRDLQRDGHGGEPGDGDPIQTLVDGLAEAGFASDSYDDEDGLRIEMYRCPFVDVARGHEDVVCSLHRGLMRGLLAGREPQLDVTALVPFVEPGRCVARLAR